MVHAEGVSDARCKFGLAGMCVCEDVSVCVLCSIVFSMCFHVFFDVCHKTHTTHPRACQPRTHVGEAWGCAPPKQELHLLLWILCDLHSRMRVCFCVVCIEFSAHTHTHMLIWWGSQSVYLFQNQRTIHTHNIIPHHPHPSHHHCLHLTSL